MNTPLDPLADFRPDGYSLDDERRARLRSRVLDAIPDDPPAGATTLVAARASTDERDELASIHVLEPLPAGDRWQPPAPRHGRHSNGRRLLVAAAVAVALGLLAVVVGTTRSSDRDVGTLDPSKITLEEMATRAESLPELPLPAGQYQHFVKHLAQRSVDGGGGYDIDRDAYWLGGDDTRFLQNTSVVRPAGALSGNEVVRVANPVRFDACAVGCFGPFVYQALRNAPTDPAGLADAVAAASSTVDHPAIAEHLATIGALTTTPPAVRAALFRALIDLGFRPAGTVVDPLDHAGAAFTLNTRERTETIVFDPNTTRTLAYWGTDFGAASGWSSASSWTAFSDAEVTGPPS